MYVNRIFRDVSVFSSTTSWVLALGLSLILELSFGLFGYLAKIFFNLFAFLGDMSYIAIVVGLLVLLIVYYLLSKMTWIFRKQRLEIKKAERKMLREAAKKSLEKIGASMLKRPETSTAAELAEKAGRWGTLRKAAKRIPIIGSKRGPGGRFAKKKK